MSLLKKAPKLPRLCTGDELRLDSRLHFIYFFILLRLITISFFVKKSVDWKPKISADDYRYSYVLCKCSSDKAE